MSNKRSSHLPVTPVFFPSVGVMIAILTDRTLISCGGQGRIKSRESA
jgi:hypothetical protein